MKQRQGFIFRSDLFSISKDEEEETNPGFYGKELANWLAKKLEEHNYDTDVIPEDWGWCVICKRNEFTLMIGCGSMVVEDYDPDNLPSGSEIKWAAFPFVEIPLIIPKIKYWFGKLDVDTALNKLDSDLMYVLNSESRVQICEDKV